MTLLRRGPEPFPGATDGDGLYVMTILPKRCVRIRHEEIRFEGLGNRIEEVFRTRVERLLLVRVEGQVEFREVIEALDRASSRVRLRYGLITEGTAPTPAEPSLFMGGQLTYTQYFLPQGAKESGLQTRGGNANAVAATTTHPRVRNCDFTRYHPLRMSDWLWHGGIEKRVELAYPSEAKRKHLQGRISVRVLIDGEGHVEQACGDGYPILREAAESAAFQWIFHPPKLNGEKIPYVQETLQFNFVLDGPSDAH